LLYLLLKDRENGKMLEYSPVKMLADTFHHQTADFPPRESSAGVVMAEYMDDLTHSQFKDNEFDTVICSHVLDAIKDEESAIKELYRITKSTAFVSAPIFEIEKTIEYGEILPENYKHYRKPGMDYASRFSIFKNVIVVKGSDYKDADIYGLEGEYVIICQK
jgi:hypothetical protein